ncbi:glucose-1-phosphate adenylyltransferase [Anaeromyxobacter oryzae]|uniref:Glucose-1-phosphate adenylyltransferase n=1 Tax=Anaeromyxobacter oryzae TaxID=2918170 RepID=A0ABM7WPC7_9BACT|nr:glucose-1-phosphate adenylyltransferase [Anaeromyxobacter oryzae]BDG01319.1 glucose-1-phosphate adenylyltransferase [Anaeromyxobacter oryzae]
MEDCLAVILGGGRGTRLFPLTQERSKPAVPIGGKYRLIDIPISNCLNSNLRRIFVLTQYNSESLNNHVGQTYKFDVFSRGFVTILAAEQTDDSGDWFQGTADAVRQSLRHLKAHRSRDVLILSGDQLFQMDFRDFAATHRNQRAAATVGVIPVPREQTAGFGILKVDARGRIIHFEEKPGPDRLDDLESDIPGYGRGFLASMGIYMFERAALEKAISDRALVDFGRHVIPSAIGRTQVQAHVFRGYWEDVGTIASYFQAGLDLTRPIPPFDFHDWRRPIYTHPRFLPATRIEGCTLRSALVSEGSILMGAEIERSVIGIRSRIGAGTRLRDTLVLGADAYESLEEMERARASGHPPLGIGGDCVIQHAIIDKNARIGRGVRILNEAGAQHADGDGYYIREGVVIVPKGGVIRDGAVI